MVLRIGTNTDQNVLNYMTTILALPIQVFCKVSSYLVYFEFSRLFFHFHGNAGHFKIVNPKIWSTSHIQPFCKVLSNLEQF